MLLLILPILFTSGSCFNVLFCVTLMSGVVVLRYSAIMQKCIITCYLCSFVCMLLSFSTLRAQLARMFLHSWTSQVHVKQKTNSVAWVHERTKTDQATAACRQS
jgi:hypothetical protein